MLRSQIGGVSGFYRNFSIVSDGLNPGGRAVELEDKDVSSSGLALNIVL